MKEHITAEKKTVIVKGLYRRMSDLSDTQIGIEKDIESLKHLINRCEDGLTLDVYTMELGKAMYELELINKELSNLIDDMVLFEGMTVSVKRRD